MSSQATTKRTSRQGKMPLSPTSKKRLNDLTRCMQRQAFNELLDIKAQNGGKLPYGAIRETVKKYADLGFSGKVTIHNLEYRFSLLSKGDEMQCEKVVPLRVKTTDNTLNISQLTDNTLLGSTIVDDNPSFDNGTSTSSRNTRGPKKNRVARKIQEREKIKAAYFNVCLLYASEMEMNRRVPSGTHNRIIKNVELEESIAPGTLKRNTIIWRIQQNNLRGVNRNSESPFLQVKPVVVDWCISLAKIGYAQTRNELIALVQEFITGTEYEVRLNEFKETRKIYSTSLGVSWYKGFMKRHATYLKK